ncbi:MAG: bifunctional 2-polyprenyl-6-hydroxyphenol methylase/3-demethylubiquinol 3-O-methyltransferase UbiG [Rhodospirillaceae bacterium]|jgi:2-polyprenyl-6-hydroxyphenyl methylase / 3-demethylubiquinone-9 3-methyltransferase|nr:bifunctional 2-polyprenyl-6-hydroxyphenol methylase/3-demethylubiquinol 3-O-methyltransferase UbiG [Rhodospirillaceae bacterium]
MPATSATGTTADPDEIGRFAALAEEWWDPAGQMALLHRLNPLRVAYIRDDLARKTGRDPLAPLPLSGLKILDVGCGGGLLSEPLARLGASVTGIDESGDLITIARAHASDQGLTIDYQHISVENLEMKDQKFDAVVSMEVVEHVTDPNAFVVACARLVAAKGSLFLATINRTAKSYALAILGAEYVLRWVPVGTHQWEKFIKPSELARAVRACGVEVEDLSGVGLNPLSQEWHLTKDTGVNYMIAGRKT